MILIAGKWSLSLGIKFALPWRRGGLGIRPLRRINEAASLKLCWGMLADSGQWARFLRAQFLGKGVPSVHYVRSSLWPALRKNLATVTDNSAWLLGDGKTIKFWSDHWLNQPILDWTHIPPHAHHNFSATVSDFIEGRSWHIPPILESRFPDLVASIKKIIIPWTSGPDQLRWSHSLSGILTFKEAYAFCSPHSQVVPWCKLIWKSCIPPSKSFLFWRLLHRGMPTDDILQARGCHCVCVQPVW